MSKIIYTIGYAGFTIENFINILKNYEIDCLIDVRSMPKSAYFSDFNRSNLSNILSKYNITYKHYGLQFGARQTDEHFYTDGVLDFMKFSKSEQFQEGVRDIEEGVKCGQRFVLMCAEKNPEVCHRNIMVAHQFYLHSYEIRNILEDGKYIEQDKVEEILLNKYFPHRNQLSLFQNLTEQEMIEQSYQKCNLEIGYKL